MSYLTKLEWCRANAPDAIKDVPDDELLEYMESAWEKYAPKEATQECVVNDLNPINKNMDYMVTTLVNTFGDKLAFKGGYMLTKLMPEFARQTQDIDFSIQTSELYQNLLLTMEDIGKRFIEDGIIAKYIIKPEIHPHCSGGMDMYSSDGKKILGIDIGWHDITFGTTTTHIDIGDVNAFEIERMLADKISAILSRKRFRRPKDIYDLYCITNCFDFSVIKVNTYLKMREIECDVAWDNFPFNDKILVEYNKAYQALRLDSIVRNRQLDKPLFNDVMTRFINIVKGLRRDSDYVTWSSEKERFV